ncbi:flavin-dependent monooxygenase [Altererythrobacter soli]|uniref:Flavin-dependent monooxygenase n=1 Tax=Croceibacterium soli TaxID=1739690 RepID=A0A6I4UTE9_9SPHN|nr:acyl-CoA dehydrogenase family protein [Croceibacterium soli]MXP42051.1 flavin-dependent monooxygenase [Croceibacterium soli]
MNAIDASSVFNVKPEERISLSALLDVVRERRVEFTRAQQVAPDVVELMRRAGIFRALVARRFGGDEMTPAEFIQIIEQIAVVDGSAAWVASFGHASAYIAALPVATLERIYENGPDVSVCGALFPPHNAKAVDGGLEVSGRWKFGSGTSTADLVGVGIKAEGVDDGGAPRMALMPRDKVTIVPNWDVNGLCGTGSHDVVVDKVVVPVEWTFIRGSAANLDGPLFRYPVMALAAQVLAVVGLGVARSALDTLIEMAGGRGSITGAPVLANRAYVQSEVAQAEAALRSARAFFYDAAEDAYATLVAGEPLPLDKVNLLRLSSTHLARVGVDVAQTAYRLSGTAAIYTDHPIARQFNDALVVAQHAFLSTGTWQSAGQILLGLESPPGFP